MATEFVHFGDVHFPGMLRGWRPADIFSKKLVGAINVKLLGRGRKFRFANAVVEAMFAEVRASLPDAILFSGDATMVALPREFANAAMRLGVSDPELPPGFAVPGNHDYYTPAAGRAGGFERSFAPWQTGVRIGEHAYPFARKIGGIWLLGVNTSYQKRGLGASGEAGADQWTRLRELCATLDAGLRIIVTHYPLRDDHGRIERANHRLRDHAAALAAAIDCRIDLWVHGHIHRPFAHVASAEIPFPLVCVGSATQEHRWSFNRYRIDGRNWTLTRRTFDPESGTFREAAVIEWLRAN